MNIVFNVNPLGMEGLGVTVTSLVRNCTDTAQLTLNFLCSGLSDADKSNVRRLLEEDAYKGQTRFIDFDAQKEFGNLRSLHGDWTTYGRFLIPDRISADRVLYLDADLAINLDVLEIERTVDLDGHVMAAVTDATAKWMMDGEFLKRAVGMSDDTPYFNAGIIYFNLEACRANGAAAEWRDFAAKHRDHLISHDQTVLNAYANGNFLHLDLKYNVPWVAGGHVDKARADHAILHFLGAPKPWDLGGSLLHSGYRHWSAHATKFWLQVYGKLTLDKVERTWRIRRSIAKVVMRRFKGAKKAA